MRNLKSCFTLKSEIFCSFEVLLFHPKRDKNLAIAVVYGPPKQNKVFINEFAIQFDRLLIVGDFNIHVCCDTNPLAKEFLSLIDNFDFIQVVTGPTHLLGHILDLILLYGVTIYDLEIGDISFSDHKPVMFTCSISDRKPII